MSISKFEDHWPDYLPSPKADIMALGVIALNYGQLENMFRHIFSIVGQLNEYQAAAIFYRLPNNIRLTIIGEWMARATLPDLLKERVEHFCAGFKTCAENRHGVMHSHTGGTFTSISRNVRGIMLSKYSRAGNEFMCPASLQELRTVADEIHTFAIFGADVASDIKNFSQCRLHGNERRMC